MDEAKNEGGAEGSTRAPKAKGTRQPKKKGKARRFLATLVILTLLAVIGLGLWYLLDRREPYRYLPGQFTAFVQVPSLSGLYEDLIELKAAEAVLDSSGMSWLRKFLLDFRSASWSSHPLLRRLTDMPAWAALCPDGDIVAVVEPGPLSLLTRTGHLLSPFLRVKGLSVISEGGFSWFRYRFGDRQLHIAPLANLVILTTDEERLRSLLDPAGEALSLLPRRGQSPFAGLKPPARGLRFLADSATLAAIPLGMFSQGKALKASLSFPAECVGDIDLTNQEACLDASIPFSTELRPLTDLLASSGGRNRVFDALPESAGSWIGLALDRLDRAVALLTAIEPGLQATISQADSAARLALGLGVEDLLFSWTDGNAGVFQMPRGSPVLVMGIRSEKRREEVFKKLFSSPFINRRQEKVGGQDLIRMDFPWYLQSLLSLAKIQVPEPRMAVKGDWLYLSQDGEALAAALSELDAGRSLARSAAWAKVSKALNSSTFCQAWYDSRERPFFLPAGNPLTAALSQYGNGLVGLSYEKGAIGLSLRAIPSARRGPVPLIGFPLETGLALDRLALMRFSGASRPRILAAGSGRLMIIDPAQTGERREIIVPDSCFVIPAPGTEGFWTQSASGSIGRWDADGKALSPFPLELDENLELPGVSVGKSAASAAGGLLLWRESKGRLSILGTDGILRDFGPELADPPLSGLEAWADGSLVSLATRGFEPMVYLFDASGSILPGWPQPATGLSSGRPRFIPSASNRPSGLSFLTQTGDLYLWNLDAGSSFPGGMAGSWDGRYSAPPLPLRAPSGAAILLMDRDGKAKLISASGLLLADASLGNPAERGDPLAADLDGDGIDEALVPSAGSVIVGLDASLAPLPGFPLPGFLGPLVADLDGDGDKDILSAGRDGVIRAYSTGGK